MNTKEERIRRVRSDYTNDSRGSLEIDESEEPSLGAKMEKKSDLERRRTEIIQRQAASLWVQNFGRFDLDHHLIINEHINSLVRQYLPLVNHRNGHFPSNRTTSPEQLFLKSQ